MGFIAIAFLGSTFAMLISTGWEAIRHLAERPRVRALARRFTRGWIALGRRAA